MDGLLLIDKPEDCTSHDVVDEVRRILGTSAVGHAGTLDPIASGLMVLLLGQATKLSDYILGQDKRYWVRARLGVHTDSGDRVGNVVQTSDLKVSEAEIRAAGEGLLGDLKLEVPIYSAVKVQGKKLYEYARGGKPVVAPVKEMSFFDLKWVKFDFPDVEFEISCQKGGYIRSWVIALGQALKCGAHVTGLRRLKSLPYDVHEAVTLQQLASLAGCGYEPGAGVSSSSGSTSRTWQSSPAFISMPHSLPDWRSCQVRGREEQLFRHGQISHDLNARLIVEQKAAIQAQKPVGIKVLGSQGQLLGLVEALPSQGLKIRRVFVH